MKYINIFICMLFVLMATGEAHAQKSVKITGQDGFPLNAMYYAGKSSGPGILLLHQCDRDGISTGYEKLAEELRSRGFHVLIPDYRTYGASLSDSFPAGEWQKSGSYMEADMEAVYQFLISQPGVDKETVGLSGASCGGRHAITLAARHKQVNAIVFVSTTVGNAALTKYHSLTHLPVRCIASRGDPYGATTRSMKSVCEASEHEASRLSLYKGKAHGTPLFEQDPSLIIDIANWFESTLKV